MHKNKNVYKLRIHSYSIQLLLRFKRDKDTIEKPTVTAVMGIKWNELTSTDPKDAWCLTSVEIAKELFNSQMIVVPKLDEAPFFDLMVCFTKPGNKTALEKVSNLIKGEYDFQLRGHLTDLIDKEGSNLREAGQKKKLHILRHCLKHGGRGSSKT